MPVRIIFRGLVLFEVKKDEGVVVAKLVGDKRTPAGVRDTPSHMPAHGGHELAPGSVGDEHLGPHDHEAELQAFSIERDMTSRKERDKVDYVGLGTRNIDITFDDKTRFPVERAASYDAYCPRLSDIMDKLTGNGNNPPRHTDKAKMDSFIRNTVTVHGGTIRVREVVSWDGGAFPLPDRKSSGVTVDTPAEVKFVGSTARGFMASECVIDVEQAESVTITGSGAQGLSNLRGSATHHSLRIPPKYVEILITNFPPQRAKALPWSAHFRWLFEAAGYRPIRLREEDFGPFEEFARKYDPGAVTDDMPLLRGADGEFPVPWLNEVIALGSQREPSRESALVGDDPWNRPLCPQGDE